MPCIPDSLCRDLRTSYLLARMLWKEGYFISPLSRLPLLHWTVLDSKEAVDLIRIVQEIEVSKFCRQKSRRCFRRQTTQMVRRPRICRRSRSKRRSPTASSRSTSKARRQLAATYRWIQLPAVQSTPFQLGLWAVSSTVNLWFMIRDMWQVMRNEEQVPDSGGREQPCHRGVGKELGRG
jgi:hypothetical protein